MAVAVNICSRQQIEGMAAVVAEDRRQLETGEQPSVIVSGIHNGSDYNLVPLVKGGKGTLTSQIRVVNWTKIAVEIRGRVKRLAERVVCQQGEM